MKPQRFEIGQAITPNTKDWQCKESDNPTVPRFGEIYYVKDYVCYCDSVYGFGWFIRIDGMPDNHSYFEEHFDPVITTNELFQDLEQLTEYATA